MKTAISVPDEVFDEADNLAKRLGIARSALYAQAVAEFLARHSPDAVTESYNHLGKELGYKPDPAFQRAARKVMENSEW